MEPALERGSGMPVVFLHGYPLHHALWQDQLEAFSARYRVIALDLPGFGLAAEESVPDSLSGFSGRVDAFLERRGLGPVVVVGHSFGGYIALQLYRDHPARFRGLVLSNTRAVPDTPETREKRMALVRRLADPRESLDLDETTRGLVAPATWERDPSLVDRVRTMVAEARSPALRGSLTAMARRPDLTPVLPSVAVPTLVLWGDEDRLIPPAQSESMVALLPDGAGVGIPGAGHLAPLEAPHAFGAALGRYLDQVSS